MVKVKSVDVRIQWCTNYERMNDVHVIRIHVAPPEQSSVTLGEGSMIMSALFKLDLFSVF